MFHWMSLVRDLTKLKISVFATLSACAGFILARGGISWEMATPGMGILLLACGSCALNQYQEREIDRRMLRTRGRPLPAGKMPPAQALLTSGVLIGSGFLVLFLLGRGWVWLLGLFAVFWYNGVYLYLKRRTAWAILPGALIGAIPPAIGWVSGEGGLTDPRLGAICFFFFIWQVPHFWVLLLIFSEDYERAGLPNLARRLTAGKLERITFFWILSTAASCILIPFLFPLNFAFVFPILLFLTFWFVWQAGFLEGTRVAKEDLKKIFVRLNVYAFLVFALLSMDRIVAQNHPPWGLIGKFISRVFPWV